MPDPLEDPDVTAALKRLGQQAQGRPELCRRCAAEPVARSNEDGLGITCIRQLRDNQLEAGRSWARRRGAKTAGETARAGTWLKYELRKGPREARVLYERADADGISKRTLQRAARDAGIVQWREGSSRDRSHRSMWALPQHAPERVTRANDADSGASNGR